MESTKKVLFKFDGNVLNENDDELQGKGVVINEPRLVDYNELNYDILKPGKQIFYFKKPKPLSYPIDLNRGYRSYTEILSSFEFGLKATLQYAMSSSDADDVNVDNIKIFTRRGVLMDLIVKLCPERNRDYRVFHVTRYNGNLYMIAKRYKRREGPVKPHHSHDAQLLKNVFTESFNKEPNTDQPFDANKRLVGVFQSSIGEFELIYSSPIYGIQADDEFEDFDDMEALNSCRFVMAKQMWDKLRNDPAKHLYYYLQAHLANVKDLYLAYKDRNGIVKEPIVHKRALDLPNEYKRHWKPSICFAFLYDFLKEVNKLMSKDDVNSLNTVYEFDVVTNGPGHDLTISYKIFKDKPEMIFVTPEYVKYCQEKV